MTFNGILSFGTRLTPAQLNSQGTFNRFLAAPIDGAVIDCFLNSGVDLSVNTYSVTPITIDDFSNSLTLLYTRYNRQQQLDDITRFGATTTTAGGLGKCSKNLIKIQFSGALVDYFSADWPIIYNRISLLGKFAALAGLNIIIDVEPYNDLWKYNSMPLKARYSFAEYQAATYAFGSALATDWRSVNRNISAMVTVSYDGYANRGPPYEANEWGLYKNFLDGFLDAWGLNYYNQSTHRGTGKVILSTETTYGELSPVNLLRYGLGTINGTFDSASPPPDQNYWGDSEYFFDPNIVEHALSLWIDKPPFDPLTPLANYWTPSAFASQLGIIMDNCNWAWIFQDVYGFYFPARIPQVYLDAINAERQSRHLPA